MSLRLKRGGIVDDAPLAKGGAHFTRLGFLPEWCDREIQRLADGRADIGPRLTCEGGGDFPILHEE